MGPTEGGRDGPVARLIEGSARNPVLALVFVAVLAAWGWWSLARTPLDAIPDLSDVQVVVFTEWPGQSPDLVEDQVTYPISSVLLAAPEVKFVRGQSMFGLSFVYVIFEDDTDLYWARSRVLEYLSTVRADLPEGVNPTLGPDATGVGWVYQYALVDESGTHDLAELRSLQDWNLRYALESVPGVAEVASVGGMVKQYQVSLDPQRMLAHGVSLQEVVRAVRESNEDAGGRILEIAGHEHVLRGRGYLVGVADLERIPVRADADGVPILLGDLADIGVGPDMRRGLAELNGEGEVAGGIVVMRYGENALNVIEAVETRLAEVQQGLPEGVRVEVVYDRSELIEASIDTLRHTLIEEAIVVSLVVLLFLLHVRSALVIVLTLPVAVLCAFIPMVAQGLTANIMSLGGIAVAIGAMVDASIIIVENVHKKLGEWEARGRPGPRREAMIAAMTEVGPSIFFSLLVITVSFLPVFTLEATEGRLFKPLAFTKTYAMAFGALLAVTATPALAVLLIRGRVRGEEGHPLNRLIVRLYAPVVGLVVDHKRKVVVASALLMLGTVPAFLALESEFMPPLNEGSLLYMPTSPPGMGVTEAGNALQATDRALAEVPEVQSVFGKIGRAETATDPAPLSMVETTVVLKPREAWREGLTWEDLVDELDQAVQVPGMPNIWWMPIQTRTEMLATGVRSPLAVQVFGDDLASIERAALAIERVVGDVPGTRSVFAERATGGFYLDVEIDRDGAARHGVRSVAINDVIRTALGGMSVTEVVEGRERYGVSVRYGRELRDDPEEIGRALVTTAAGGQVPLSQVARLVHRTGPPMIRSEDGKLVGFVFIDPGDRPVGGYVEEARGTVEAAVDLPPGVRLAWTGQFKYMERAQERLATVVPLTLGLVFLLLYLNTRSVAQTLIVLLAVPFSLVGAVWLLWLLDYHLSVAVWVGIIALAGLDAETGVVMLLYLTLSHERWTREGRLRTSADLRQAIVEGAAHRIRPKLMTVTCLMLGLAPILWSDGTGADVMRRIAAPMVGGLVTSFLLELTVYPAIFAWWKGRTPGRPPAAAATPLAPSSPTPRVSPSPGATHVTTHPPPRPGADRQSGRPRDPGHRATTGRDRSHRRAPRPRRLRGGPRRPGQGRPGRPRRALQGPGDRGPRGPGRRGRDSGRPPRCPRQGIRGPGRRQGPRRRAPGLRGDLAGPRGPARGTARAGRGPLGVRVPHGQVLRQVGPGQRADRQSVHGPAHAHLRAGGGGVAMSGSHGFPTVSCALWLGLASCGTRSSEPPPGELPDSGGDIDEAPVELPATLDLPVSVTLDGEPTAGIEVTQPGVGEIFLTDDAGEVVLPLDTTIIGALAVAASHPDARIQGEELRPNAVPDVLVIELTRFDRSDNLDYSFQDSGTPERYGMTSYCAHCHVSFVGDWWDSPHRSATSNVVVQDLYAGVATAWSDAADCADAGGTLRTGIEPGTRAEVERCYLGVGTLPDLNEDCGVDSSCDGVAEHTGACADCHAPAIDGVLGGRDLLEADELAHETGIGCDLCHKVERVDLDSTAPGVAGRLQILRPTEDSPSPGLGEYAPLTFGPFRDVLNPRMGSVYRDHYTNGQICAGCHEYEQEALVPGAALDTTRWPDGRLPVHSTWSEWEAGPYADQVACTACHMPAMAETGNGADLGNYIDASHPDTATGWFRPAGDVRRHAWYGPRSEVHRMIDLAGAVSLDVTVGDDGVHVALTTKNVGPAHALPTGEPLRHMLALVEATCGDEALAPTGGDVVPDFGGLRAEKFAGEDWTVWPEAEVGDRVRVLRRAGDWHDYTGTGPFGDGRFDAEAKGMPADAWAGEVEIVEVDEGQVSFDAELPEGEVAWLVADAGGLPDEGDAPVDLAGRPGFGFARVMVGPNGSRMVPHFLAVDVASDNRLLPQSSWTSHHAFAPCEDGAVEVQARLVYRRLPPDLAAERGWELADNVMNEAIWREDGR